MITKDKIMEALKLVKDPEIGMDIVTLELIYEINVNKDNVNIKMTFTTPGCPYGPALVEDVKREVGKVKGVKKVDVEVVFEPAWKPSDELKETLGVA